MTNLFNTDFEKYRHLGGYDLFDYVLDKPIESLTPDHVGMYIIRKTRTIRPFTDKDLGQRVRENDIIYAPLQIRWFNRELFRDNEYKVRLTPIGKFRYIATDRSYYNCDVSQSLSNGISLLVDDPLVAYDIAKKLNQKIFSLGDNTSFFGRLRRALRILFNKQ